MVCQSARISLVQKSLHYLSPDLYFLKLSIPILTRPTLAENRFGSCNSSIRSGSLADLFINKIRMSFLRWKAVIGFDLQCMLRTSGPFLSVAAIFEA